MSDPSLRIPARPRLPKSYTDQQLAFLKGHLPEFERRTQGSVRGDAKKFALERAAEFISTFGLPDDYAGVEEAEPRFKEQIYNWFKNTVGRTRRKLEGKPRSMKKALEKKQQQESAANISLSLGSPTGDTSTLSNAWTTNVAAPTIMPYAAADHSGPSTSNQTLAPIPYGGVQPSAVLTPITATPAHPTSHTAQHAPSHTTPLSAHSQPSPRQHHSSLGLATLPITTASLREAFITGIDASSLASMIRSFVMSNPPSQTPLVPVVDALFEAVTTDSSFNQEPHAYLRRFLDASTCFSSSIVHAGISGPLAGPRALQMQIRKFSIWIPSPAPFSSSSSTMADEVQRIANDRQRKKDHIQWARIHAAALELGVLNLGHSNDSDNYQTSRVFSEMMARDAVWEKDEVEWVAGVYVLRAVIRTAMRGDQRQRDEYEELLRTYENRWKEMRDEARQALVTDVLLATRDDLALLDRMS
ncbi:hypothetical protein D9758_002990 [Tetrapyrgos nigripes]|uniref:Uncharacterized protein n=1 Tax=Tetrapyrgos nigripes TaxID=182062 RepID=A0A8H5GQG2_9AGAR|nr:hypothetical protein D9758_002990 [Tetrapyrgos nigripes]